MGLFFKYDDWDDEDQDRQGCANKVFVRTIESVHLET